MEDGAAFEGQLVDDRFPLTRYLGGRAHSAVYLTEYENARAAVKFVPYSAAQLAAWEEVAQLEHPGLVRVFAGGEHSLGENHCVYIVTEYADDSLAPTLAARHLTPLEAHDMLAALTSALVYLHGKGYSHGRLRASNIMAIGDRVALSSDSVSRDSVSSAADDCLALGRLLRQAIPSLPAPFLEIVQHCEDANPESRWTAAMIESRLQGKSAPAAASPGPVPVNRRPPWMGAAVGAALVVVAGALWFGRGSSSPAVGPAASAAVHTQASADTRAPAAKRPLTAPKRSSDAAVITEVLPEIPQPARNTITGRVRINVRVAVDREGTVTEAALEPPKASKYFTERVLAAARRWKFRSSKGRSQEWILRFELFPNDTKVSVAPDR